MFLSVFCARSYRLERIYHLQDGMAYAHLLNVLAPELNTANAMETKDPNERANLILEQADKMDCKRYVTPDDIVEGSTNLNIAFVAEIFQHRSDYFDNNIMKFVLPHHRILYVYYFVTFTEACKNVACCIFTLCCTCMLPSYLIKSFFNLLYCFLGSDPTVPKRTFWTIYSSAAFCIGFSEPALNFYFIFSRDYILCYLYLILMLLLSVLFLRNGLHEPTEDTQNSYAEMMTDDAENSREERCFRLWINSLGTATYVNNLFEDIRPG